MPSGDKNGNRNKTGAEARKEVLHIRGIEAKAHAPGNALVNIVCLHCANMRRQSCPERVAGGFGGKNK